jgi:4-hydroxy-tetrahydrodipicolinate synthase
MRPRLPLIALGGDGLVSVCSNEIPKETSRMVAKALEGAFTAARKIHYQILPLMEANFIESSPAPCKFVMKEMGLVEENLRLPLVPIMKETQSNVACGDEGSRVGENKVWETAVSRQLIADSCK